MSDVHTSDHDAPHDGPIKTPKQLVWAVVFAFLVPIVAIVLLVTYVAAGKKPGAGSDFMAAEAVARRIQPVGELTLAAGGGAAAGVLKTGEQVFQAQCSACHGTGAAGAPKFGDEGAWAPRIKTGYAALVNSALKGKGNMPPQGGSLSEVEVGRAVVYMANKAGAKFEEPKAPAAAGNGAMTAAATDAGPAAPALYTSTCSACHATGAAGAPKFGDKAAWAPRLAQGVDGLTASAIKGKNAMPPKGGSSASDAEIKTVVAYMVNAVK